jgi:hypothetical protein
MSQFKAIPQPTDQRNVSQNDILTNFQYLSTPLNPTGGVPNGILPVDHFATGDNVANPTDGFHKQVSFQDRATPASLANAINSQNSSGIEYSKTDGAGFSQLRYYNGNIDQPISYLKAAVNFSGGGTILGNSFNVASITVSPPGDYTINFTTALSGTAYIVMGNVESTSNPPTPRVITTYTKLAASVRVLVSNATTGALSSPPSLSVMVIGFF